MAVEKETLYIIDCDTGGCSESAEWQLGPRAYVIDIARDNGWGFKIGRGGKVTLVACPEHNDFDNGE